MCVRSADEGKVQRSHAEWCERWVAALDATRGLAWEDVVAVISGTAEWQAMWAAGEHALLAARIAWGESVIKCGYSSERAQ